MKILFITPYVYLPEYKEHKKNKSGFGIMVHDIISMVGKCGNNVVVATHSFGPERRCNEFSVLKNNVLLNLFYGKYKGLVSFYLKLRKSGGSLKEMVRATYYYLNIGYIEQLVKKEKPDVVHIHGCSIVIHEIVAMLRKHEIPLVITLHGLLQDDKGASIYLKKCECELIKNSYAEKIPITVISSRMKDRFCSEYYGAERVDNVSVITNGIDVVRKTITGDVFETLKHNKRVILSVGSVCELKNQKQIVRSFLKLPVELRESTILMLVGAVQQKYSILQEIENLGLEDKVYCVGFVPREELHNYYSVADISVTASVTEGFGLPIIEGFVYGVPSVAFADLDAIPDLYDECAMFLCHERNDEALADVMSEALNTKINKEKIIEHSERFSLEAMTNKYQRLYNQLRE